MIFNDVPNDSILAIDDPAQNCDIYSYTPDFDENIKVWSQKIPTYQELKSMICYIDIETRGLRDYEIKYILAIQVKLNGQSYLWDLGFKDNNVNQFYDGLYSREKALLTSFIKWLESQNIFILTGHNIFDFDLPYIMERCEWHQIHHGFVYKPGYNNRKTEVKNSMWHGRPIEFDNITHHKFNIIDTIHLCGIADKMESKLQSFGLKYVCSPDGYDLRGERVDIPGNKIFEYFLEHHDQFLKYLNDDIIDLELLFDRLFPPHWYLMEYVPNYSIQDLVFAGNGQIWNNILYKHYGYKPEPDNKSTYPGGFTGIRSGVFENCVKLDVSSLYPSIMLAQRIHSSKDPDMYQLRVLSLIKRIRLQLKELGNQGNKEAKYQSLALKILINSAYGMLGTIGISFNDMNAAAAITMYGRAVLDFMINSCKSMGADIVQADTDGIIISDKDPEWIHKELQNNAPEWVLIDLEDRYNFVWIYKRKNYITYEGDKVKAIGLVRKRGKCELFKRFLKHLPKVYIEHGLEGCKQFKDNIVEAIRTHSIDVKLLSESKKITHYKDKTVNDKIAKQLNAKPGDNVKYYRYDAIEEYITPKTKQKRTRSFYGYRRLSEYNEEFPYSIDYYINEIEKFKEGKTRDKNTEGWFAMFEQSIINPINETYSGELL